ncbi:transposase [Paenibacillus sp. FSL H8-0261]|uniref:transposase n=1 Tax=Paenibacillus sp. FSL H8-0261 TaxID=2921381 RepID=UPI00324521D3
MKLGGVLGIDDFAILEGHTCNTGLHDLRGDSLLDIILGRTSKELLAYYENHPAMGLLNPVAVVMDLAYFSRSRGNLEARSWESPSEILNRSLHLE